MIMTLLSLAVIIMTLLSLVSMCKINNNNGNLYRAFGNSERFTIWQIGMPGLLINVQQNNFFCFEFEILSVSTIIYVNSFG